MLYLIGRANVTISRCNGFKDMLSSKGIAKDLVSMIAVKEFMI